MPTTGTDISIVLSGGSGNLDPNFSIGGDPSSAPVVENNLNNLFDDITPDEVDAGHEDYRCLYLFNDGDTNIFQCKMWISNDYVGGSVIEMGIEERNQIHRIEIGGVIPISGYMHLRFHDVGFNSEANADVGEWATELQATLNALELSGELLAENANVSAQLTGETLIFDIEFAGIDAKKSHPPIILHHNYFDPSGEVTINISSPQSGTPINSIAPNVNLETTPPGGVGFFVPTEQSPIDIPKLLPGDGFPFWIKRTTPVDVTAVESDGFIMKFAAEALKP